MAELLSIQEVARITGLHEITIRRYIRSGKLEAVRIGRRIRVRREALDRMVKPMHLQPEPESDLQSELYLKESTGVYEAAVQSPPVETMPEVVGRITLQLLQLPAEDVSTIERLVTQLRQQRLHNTARFLASFGAWRDERPLEATLADIHETRRSRTEPPAL